jgi:voltage-gated potassium channel Kch
MKLPKQRKGRLHYLLVSLVLFIVLYNFTGEGLAEQIIFDLIMVGILVSVVFLVKQTRRSLVISILLGAPWVIVTIMDVFMFKGRHLVFATTAFGIVFFLYVTRVIFENVARSKRVTRDTISGAIAVYLLLGILWAAAYRLLEAIHPGSFTGPLGINPETGVETPNYVYFSFTTLTTLGYGDITPATMPTKAVAILEAVAGPLYITILISQLVSKYVSRSVEKEVEEEVKQAGK